MNNIMTTIYVLMVLLMGYLVYETVDTLGNTIEARNTEAVQLLEKF